MTKGVVSSEGGVSFTYKGRDAEQGLVGIGERALGESGRTNLGVSPSRDLYETSEEVLGCSALGKILVARRAS